jgi:hypothetical protein
MTTLFYEIFMSIHNNSVVTSATGLQEPNKTIDESFFFQNPSALGPSRVLNTHKWRNMRKSIQKGDYIRIDIAPIPQNQPKRATAQLWQFPLELLNVDGTAIQGKTFTHLPKPL